MINIIKITSEIANTVGKANDIVIVRRIQLAVQDYCTRFIRDTVMSHKIVPDAIIARIQKKIVPVEIMSDYYINDNIKCKQTVSTVEDPIRLFDSTPFISVSSPSGHITFSHCDLTAVRFELGDQFSNGARYVYHNGIVVLYSTNPILLGFNKVKLAFVPENPLAVVDEGGDVAYGLENYPAPADLTSIIVTEILGKLFPNVKPSVQEIKVDD